MRDTFKPQTGIRQSTRRQVLKAAGLTFALPWLESVPLAAGEGAGGAPKIAPLRYIHIYFATGFTRRGEDWMCSGQGSEFKLGKWLNALEPYKQYVTQLRQLCYDCGPHTHFQDYLSGYPMGPTRSGHKLIPGAPYSLDQVIADVWAGQGAELHSFILGADVATKGDPHQTSVSRRVGATCPRYVSPGDAFDSLFDGPQERDKDRSILDLVREQAKALEVSVSASDKIRLDQYQTSIRDLEKRIADAERPRPVKAWKPVLLEPDMERPAGIPTHLPDYHALMLDLALLALKMDKTRVATMMIANESSHFRYDFLGNGVSGGLHEISHGHGGGGKSHALIVEYYASQCARFVKGCAEVDEGNGTLLDNILIQYGSSMADGGGHNSVDIPQLLIGGAGGRHKGARIIEAPQGTPLCEAGLGIMQMLGLEIERFGEATKPVKI